MWGTHPVPGARVPHLTVGWGEAHYSTHGVAARAPGSHLGGSLPDIVHFALRLFQSCFRPYSSGGMGGPEGGDWFSKGKRGVQRHPRGALISNRLQVWAIARRTFLG